jgi:hypothetical protein
MHPFKNQSVLSIFHVKFARKLVTVMQNKMRLFRAKIYFNIIFLLKVKAMPSESCNTA